MKKYGPTYDLSMEPDSRVEEIYFGDEQSTWFLDNMVDRVNAECETLLDDGDYDFFDYNACLKLKEVIVNQRKLGIPDFFQDAYKALLTYVERAIDYGTGIAIEL